MRQLTRLFTRLRGPSLLMVATVMAPSVVFADMSYSYLQGGYIHTNPDGSGSGNGATVEGALEFNDTLFGFAGYAGADFGAVDGHTWGIGIGAHLPLNENTDWVFTGGFLKAKAKADFGIFSSSASDSGGSVSIGIRSELADEIEVEAGVNYTSVSTGDFGAYAEGRYYFSEETAVGVGVGYADDASTAQVVLRIEF